jgi:DNA-binding transcriptional LysR family regulator
MQDFNLARQAVADAESTEVLRVGTLATLPAGLLERIVSVARGMDPLQQLEILDGSEREIANMLDEGRIDLAITLIRPGTERATDEILLKEDYCAVLPDRHRLAGAGMVRGEELASETMILRRHCEVLAETSRYFTDRNVRPLFGFVTTSDERALAMVRAGLGVTVMAAGNAMPGIALARLKGFGLERRIGLRRGERSVAEGGAFAAAARSCLQSAGEEGGPHARS